MFKRSLVALAATLFITGASAATQTFDNFPSGTVINNAIAGLTFREPLSNGAVPISLVPFNGGNVLSLNGNIAFNATEGAIDVLFSTPQRSVSVQAAAHREHYYLGTAHNRPFLEAYNASGAVVAKALFLGPLPSGWGTTPFETLKVVSNSTDIVRVRMSSQASQGGSPIDGIFDTLAYSLTTEPTGTVYDDFSVRNTRWTRSTAGTGIASTLTKGELYFEVSPTTTGADVYHRWTATCQLTGDFDLQVDYQHSGRLSGVRAALIAEGAGHVERTSLSKTDIYTAGEYYITNISGYVPGFVSTTDSQGSLRLQRNGNLMTSYYRPSGSTSWKSIYQQYVTTANLPFALQVWTHDWAYARQGAWASFDNLQLASGRFFGKGCPQ